MHARERGDVQRTRYASRSQRVDGIAHARQVHDGQLPFDPLPRVGVKPAERTLKINQKRLIVGE